MTNKRTVKAAGLGLMPMSLLSRTASSASSELLIEPRDLGFQIARKGSHDDEGTVTIAVSTVTEKAADGTAVGITQSPPHHHAVFSNLDVSRRNGTESRRDDIPATAVSVSTRIPGHNTTFTLSAYTYLGSGESTTLDPSTVTEHTLERSTQHQVNNRTVRLDLEVTYWRFCTPFGRGGGVACLAKDQGTFLELPWAPPNLAAPPPPHTLLIPRCDEDTIATLWFICDPRLPLCADVIFVKFYLGEARLPLNQAPNVATIEEASAANATVALEGAEIGVYAHNLTRSELVSLLNVTDLSPGVEYTFWTVWGHDNGSVPESNTRDVDLDRTQYWQCPGTLIERNFEVGASLHVEFSVNASCPLLALCGSDLAESQVASSQGRLGKGASEKGSQSVTGRGLHGEQHVSCVPGGGSLPAGRWGKGGARMHAGNLSAIQFSSGAELDGTWVPLIGGSSTVNTSGEFVAAIGRFNRTAVYSITLFFGADEQLTRSETEGSGTKIPTWVFLGSSAFLSLCVGCCIVRLVKRLHTARTSSTALVLSKRRSRGAAVKHNSGAFGDASGSINLGNDDGKELHIFAMPTPGATVDPLSPSSSSNSAAFDGWTASEPIAVSSSRVRRPLRDGSQTNDPTPVSDCSLAATTEASLAELQPRTPEANATRCRAGP